MKTAPSSEYLLAQRSNQSADNLGRALDKTSAELGDARVRFAPSLVKSDALFAGAKELVIDHAGEIYKLRKTSLGKLILTK